MIGLADGGNGGDGGDVYFRATARVSNLFDLRRAHFLGNNGKYGKVNKFL
jgi:GTPase involved in cell partitioning and DNA repair